METGRVGVVAHAFLRRVAGCPCRFAYRSFLVLALSCGSVVSDPDSSHRPAIPDFSTATTLLAGACRMVTTLLPDDPQRGSRPVTATMGIRN